MLPGALLFLWNTSLLWPWILLSLSRGKYIFGFSEALFCRINFVLQKWFCWLSETGNQDALRRLYFLLFIKSACKLLKFRYLLSGTQKLSAFNSFVISMGLYFLFFKELRDCLKRQQQVCTICTRWWKLANWRCLQSTLTTL